MWLEQIRTANTLNSQYNGRDIFYMLSNSGIAQADLGAPFKRFSFFFFFFLNDPPFWVLNSAVNYELSSFCYNKSQVIPQNPPPPPPPPPTRR